MKAFNLCELQYYTLHCVCSIVLYIEQWTCTRIQYDQSAHLLIHERHTMRSAHITFYSAGINENECQINCNFHHIGWHWFLCRVRMRLAIAQTVEVLLGTFVRISFWGHIRQMTNCTFRYMKMVENGWKKNEKMWNGFPLVVYMQTKTNIHNV